MIIRRVRMRQFMAHVDLTIDLPDTGVVLITGPNGAGKSAIIEACAHALYGKSVRGEWGWRDVPDGAPTSWRSSVEVTTDLVHAERTKRKASPSLEWSKDIAGTWHPDKSDNTTKAQVGLERVIGGFDLWLRSHVFSSGDAAHFTLATDAKRKRLLEAMLGIEYFDGALASARQQLATVKEDLAALDQRVTALDAKRTINDAAMATARSLMAQAPPVIVVPPHPGALTLPPEPEYPAIGPVPDPPDPPAPLPPFNPGAPDPAFEDMRRSLARIDLDLAAVAEDLSDARLSERTYRRDFTEARGRLTTAQAELAKWPGGTCPTCEQPVPAALLGPLTERAQAVEAEALASARVATDGITAVEAEIESLEAKRVELEAKAQSLRDHVSRHDAQRQERLNARAEMEQRHADEVARCNRQRQNAATQHQAAHKQRVDAMRQRWESECSALKREHEIRVGHHINMQAEADRMLAEHAASVAHYTNELTTLAAVGDDIAAGLASIEAERVMKLATRDELEAMEDVFGLKGVRANVLGNALSGLESLTNTWLQRIGKPGQQIRLREYTERDKGGNTPALSLELMHLMRPSWYKYKACSGGERRRVDVALILALAEVGRAVHGRSRGTLFFDEVFDALDVTGVDKVTDVIHDLGVERCVVVISHNNDLVSRLNPAVHIQLEGSDTDDAISTDDAVS